jgi:hypothetical protein
MIQWFKTNMPGTYKFIVDFLEALSNNNKGHSLKKLLAVGFFWLSAICVFRYTDKDNVEVVLAILTSMITALVITNTVSKYKVDKLVTNTEPKEVTDEPK